MRYVKYLFLLCAIFSITSFAQTRATLSVVDESLTPSGPHRIDAAPLLEQYYKRNGLEPEKFSMPTGALRKTTAWNFKVGDAKSFKLADLSPSGVTYSSSFTCRKVGTYCYIFVEDSLWTSRVDQNAVDSVQVNFDSKTPANKSKGIYLTDTGVFGTPPDVDSDPKIIILIHNIKDGFSGSGGYVAGFFSPNDETGANGNSPAEVYHMDANPLNLKSNSGLQVGLSTAAHEFQHMIHYNYIKSATSFINEGFSLTAEVICGYGVYSQSGYANETNHYLLDWRDNSDPKVLNDYSRAARFFLYIYEQFGSAFFTKYLTNKGDGIMGMNNVFSQIGSSRQFVDIIPDWFMANILNNKNVKAEWGYTYPNLLAVSTRTHTNPNVTYSESLYKFASQFITFSNGKNLSIKFTDTDNWGITVKAIKIGTGTPVVENVNVGSTYTVPDFGTTYSKVVFAVCNASSILLSFPASQMVPYSYTATGAGVASLQELKHDLTEPTGYLQLTEGDSIAVTFDGVSGAKLDSVKIALRGILPIAGSVKAVAGLAAHIGGKTLATFTATSKLTAPPAVVNTTGDYPYAAPYQNWVKVDLRSSNVDASNAFLVELPIGPAYPASNRVLSTYYTSATSYYSYAFKSTSEPGAWTYYGVSGRDGVIFLFLIRAYVTIGTTGVEGPVEIIPSQFSMDQNYPNPFNPSTIISYNLPKQSTVQIKIYDAIGNEVRSLIDEFKPAGKYNILWDARNNLGSKVSSGVYYYRITAGDFVQSKKMILMK